MKHTDWHLSRDIGLVKLQGFPYAGRRTGFDDCIDPSASAGRYRSIGIDRRLRFMDRDQWMRLAHYIQRYPPALGGSEAYFARLSRYCAAHGDAVTVLTSNAEALEAFWSPGARCLLAGRQREDGVEIQRYPLWRMPGRRWLLKPLSLFPNRLWQCLTMPCNPIAWDMWHDARTASWSLDAVHAAAFPYAWPIVCAWKLARRLRIPFLLTPFLHLGNPSDPHDPTRRGYTTPALRWLLGQADVVFVQTPGERSLAHQLGVSSERIILQGLGVEPRECTGGDRDAARRRWQLPPDALVIGHLANHSWEKGTNDLLQALMPLWQQGRPYYLLTAGPRMPNFERFWHGFQQHNSGLALRYVRLLGPVSDPEKRDFYACIDLFALPSRSDSFGLVLLEAWANGLANVAYRAGGVAEVIHQEQDGLLVDCGALPRLTEALARLLEDPGQRQRLGSNGQARVPIEFHWPGKLALVRHHYARLAGQNRDKQTMRLPATEDAALNLAP